MLLNKPAAFTAALKIAFRAPLQSGRCQWSASANALLVETVAKEAHANPRLSGFLITHKRRLGGLVAIVGHLREAHPEVTEGKKETD